MSQETTKALSKEATDLLFSFWRKKSLPPHDSLFRTWASGYMERDSDAVSCRINDIVNFLAELFHKGYQYRSLNAYRSDVSSVHKVDGVEIGEDPRYNAT